MVVIAGSEEIANGTLKVKNLTTSTQQTIGKDELKELLLQGS
jgi:histidyl-tRNA synthetase